MGKAIKEAKVNSSWIQPNESWDAALCEFITAILSGKKGNTFTRLFQPLADEIAQLGAINSLSQVLLKLTAPGVPDIYQGNEIWDLSLVDPDNRRAVDYETRRNLLTRLTGSPAADFLANWRDGRIKLFLTHKLLKYRRDHFDLFAHGDYSPILGSGTFSDSIFAYARRHEASTALIIAPRLTRRVGFPPIGDCWQDTTLDFQPTGPMRDIFTGAEFSTRISDNLRSLPFAVFVTNP